MLLQSVSVTTPQFKSVILISEYNKFFLTLQCASMRQCMKNFGTCACTVCGGDGVTIDESMLE